MKKLKNKKGFTMIEIIVVLVILAILAAAAIPTMLGFVDDAKGKAEIANARSVYIAAQMIATEEAATKVPSTLPTKPTAVESAIKIGDILGTEDFGKAMIRITAVKGKVTKTEYNYNGYTVIIEPNKAATVIKADVLK